MTEQDAPKVTVEQIEAAIESESYIFPENTNLTLCILRLKNGIDVIGSSACVSDANFDNEVGKQIAREAAVDSCWPLLGFQLASELTGWSVL